MAGSGQVAQAMWADDGKHDNIVNLALFQLKLLTRAELGKNLIWSLTFEQSLNCNYLCRLIKFLFMNIPLFNIET